MILTLSAYIIFGHFLIFNTISKVLQAFCRLLGLFNFNIKHCGQRQCWQAIPDKCSTANQLKLIQGSESLNTQCKLSCSCILQQTVKTQFCCSPGLLLQTEEEHNISPTSVQAKQQKCYLGRISTFSNLCYYSDYLS